MKAISGKLQVLTPKRLKELYDKSMQTGEPIVLWAADERYVRELEEWFRNNMRYTRELQLHRTYLLDFLSTLREDSENNVSIPEDP